jgi:uncharacterized protein (DUF488 family)
MRFYTIGYGNRTPETFLDILQEAAVRTVIDIRDKPSGRIYSYTKTGSDNKGIQGLLSTRGIAYLWLKELGNPFRNEKEWRPKYTALLATVWENAYPRLLRVKEPACIMCGCLRGENCHRQDVANLLLQEGHEVLHL